MKVRIIPVGEIKENKNSDWVDNTRHSFIDGDNAYIPVNPGFSFDTIIPERKRKGRGFQRLDDTILFHGDIPTKDEINQAVELCHPACILHVNGHTGIIRKPDITILYGTPHVVTHHEAGIIYQLNPCEVMFSQGNREEKKRIASLIKPDEKICDMFAGIGYFTLMAAKSGGFVTACEINPTAFHYLTINIEINGLTDKIIPCPGNCLNYIDNPSGWDRILMGHFEAVNFLERAVQNIKQGGTIHLHTINEEDTIINNVLKLSGRTCKQSIHKVKKVSPKRWHLVYDLQFE